MGATGATVGLMAVVFGTATKQIRTLSRINQKIKQTSPLTKTLLESIITSESISLQS